MQRGGACCWGDVALHPQPIAAIGVVPGSEWDPGALPGCRTAATACPMGHIFCLFDLPLTFAVTAGKADPIDFMWIMIFCRSLWNLLIVHTAIYSISEWESEIFWWCERLSAHTIVELTLLYFLLSDGTRHFKIDNLCPVWKLSEIFCLLSKGSPGCSLQSWLVGLYSDGHTTSTGS